MPNEEEKKLIQEQLKRQREADLKALRERLEAEKLDKFKKGNKKSENPRGGGSDDR